MIFKKLFILYILSLSIRSYTGNLFSTENKIRKTGRLRLTEKNVLNNVDNKNYKNLYYYTKLSNQNSCMYCKIISKYLLARKYYYSEVYKDDIPYSDDISLEYFLSIYDNELLEAEDRIYSMFYIALIYIKKNNPIKAFSFFKRLSEQNIDLSINNISNYFLGEFYYRRYLIKQDSSYKTALIYFNKVIDYNSDLKQLALNLKQSLIESTNIQSGLIKSNID